jgi:23S rRNA (uracil-5-)-methyltransferase RumA
MSDSICPISEFCGGCTYQGVSYDEQLEIKNSEVMNYLKDAGVDCRSYTGIHSAPSLTGYRNKMEYSFGDEVKGGPMTLGLYKKRSYMSVLEMKSCMIVSPDFDLIRNAVLEYMRERGYTPRNKKTRDGYLRNLVIRRGERTGELLINLVTTNSRVLDAEEFVSMLLALPSTDTIVGILHTEFSGRADTIACDKLSVLYGRDYYIEEMLGLKFTVNVFSFFQTNTSAVEAMFNDAFKLLPDLAQKRVFDLYCGAGTISLAIAPRCREVIGIEIVEDSVNAAIANADANGINNCTFIAGDAYEVMGKLEQKPDMVILDPPRMGLHPKALSKLISYELPELLYISCNPKSFARDMAVLAQYGYRIDVMGAYDNFPLTKHIETVARIVK